MIDKFSKFEIYEINGDTVSKQTFDAVTELQQEITSLKSQIAQRDELLLKANELMHKTSMVYSSSDAFELCKETKALLDGKYMAHILYCISCYENGHITITKPNRKLCFECEAYQLHQELAQTKAELEQQRFNNQHNLSIDQKVSDEIARLKAELEQARELLRLARIEMDSWRNLSECDTDSIFEWYKMHDRFLNQGRE